MHSTDKTSPLHLSSVLNNLSLEAHSNTADPMNATYSLKLGNIPADISTREAHTIFALATNLVSVELTQEQASDEAQQQQQHKPVVIATFNSLEAVVRYAQLLVSKTDVFGPAETIICHVEVVNNATHKSVPFQTLLAAPADGRSSSQFSNQGAPLLGMNPMIGSHIHQQPGQNAPTIHPNSSTGPVVPLNSSRSKFSFSDPFSSSGGMAAQDALQQGAAGPGAASGSVSGAGQTAQGGAAAATGMNQSHNDLSVNTTDVGKSFLLMDNDEINDTIWGPSAMPSSMSGLSSTPQPSTPTVEWGNPSSSRKQSSAFFLPNSASTVQGMDVSGVMAMPKVSSSIQPYGSMLNQMGAGASGPGQGGMQGMMDPSDMGFQQPPKQQQQQQQGGFSSSSPYKTRINPNSRSMNEGSVSMAGAQNSRSASTTNIATGSSSNLSKINSTSKLTSSKPVSKGNNGQPSSSISQADLSLLARVPPPANPADQNPPCNTLYVGNLPPDATEAELRQLFSNQQGFRRLSFRNKNNNGNGHGPMCFVEFDDVSFATRALAELYGSQLPRTTISNKGGIRLSFSKNPLGVRGPNSRRNINSGSSGNIPGTQQASNGSMLPLGGSAIVNSASVPYSYTNNYGKN